LVNDVSGQPIGPNFKSQAQEQRSHLHSDGDLKSRGVMNTVAPQRTKNFLSVESVTNSRITRFLYDCVWTALTLYTQHPFILVDVLSPGGRKALVKGDKQTSRMVNGVAVL